MIRRMNIQAHIDPIIEGRKYLVDAWDDEGHKAIYRVKAKSEAEAFQKALAMFEEEFQ